jgi:hypothetical protein
MELDQGLEELQGLDGELIESRRGSAASEKTALGVGNHLNQHGDVTLSGRPRLLEEQALDDRRLAKSAVSFLIPQADNIEG